MQARRTPLVLALALAGASVAPAVPASTEDRLQRLEARVQVVSDLAMDTDRLKRENSELRGLVEELQNEVEGLKRRIRELATDVDRRLGQPAAGGAPAAAADRPAAPAAEKAAPAPADDAAEQSAYDAAFRHLQKKQYKEAAAAFQGYLKKFPDGRNADDAHYWLGETLDATKDTKGALAEFQTVVDQYPKSEKVPNALLKIGAIQQARGDTKAAEATLSKVVKSYPQSTAAKLAQKRLESLRAGSR
jgi:tol-pal system protein YbgF